MNGVEDFIELFRRKAWWVEAAGRDQQRVRVQKGQVAKGDADADRKQHDRRAQGDSGWPAAVEVRRRDQGGDHQEGNRQISAR